MTTAIDPGLGAELAADLATAAFTLAKRFAAGATMFLVGAKSGRAETTSVSFAVGPSGGIIGLGGRF